MRENMNRLTIKLPALRNPFKDGLVYKYKANVLGSGFVEDDKENLKTWLCHEVIDRLGEYEDIGLEPYEVKDLKKECELIDGYNCSLCGASQAGIRKKYSNYCSNCGAKIIK